jgi:hypothetical protein
MEIVLTNQFVMPGPMPRAPTDNLAKFARWFDSALAKKGRGANHALANLLHVPDDRVSKMRKGERKPQASELPIIEEFLDDLSPLRDNARVSGRSKGVRVVGYVGAGATEHRYDVAESDLDEVAPPMGSNERTVAVEIRGDSLGAVFDRWLVFYDDVRSPVTADLLGHLCVVGLDDDRALIKKLRGGKMPGTFDLISENGEPIRSARVLWAARVKSMTPR